MDTCPTCGQLDLNGCGCPDNPPPSEDRYRKPEKPERCFQCDACIDHICFEGIAHAKWGLES